MSLHGSCRVPRALYTFLMISLGWFSPEVKLLGQRAYRVLRLSLGLTKNTCSFNRYYGQVLSV